MSWWSRRRPLARRVNAFCEIRRSPVHGDGLFASRPLPAGMRLTEYVGQRISKAESQRRGRALVDHAKQHGGGAVYIFELNARWDVDGNFPWNPARLINHACEPNCEVRRENGQLFVYTVRPIRRGEEFNYDYGYGFEHWMDHPCRCGSPVCVGFIVASPHRDRLRRFLARRQAGRSLVNQP
jgi:uncharacterized protein